MNVVSVHWCLRNNGTDAVSGHAYPLSPPPGQPHFSHMFLLAWGSRRGAQSVCKACWTCQSINTPRTTFNPASVGFLSTQWENWAIPYAVTPGSIEETQTKIGKSACWEIRFHHLPNQTRAMVNSKGREDHPRRSVWKMSWLCPKKYSMPPNSCECAIIHLNDNRKRLFPALFKLYIRQCKFGKLYLPAFSYLSGDHTSHCWFYKWKRKTQSLKITHWLDVVRK